MIESIRRRQTAVSVVVLAVLAYLPSLTAAPGRMPTDSKLYVYLDPGRFIADTTTTFDPRQFAGWVPHQHIAYLWPTGPWFWVFETLGVPDWIAHRLWIGTLLFVAGLGVRWMSRVLGFAPLAALVAALVYQLSPYILPYISRTSVLLLPYAGLGWIVGMTVLASWRGRWRYPAAIALVVATVGAVNATALAMVIPAPALWLLHAAWSRTITWRRAIGTGLRTGVLCVGVSLWWMMMLIIQGRHGADVLAYSESLESVSFTSTSTEVTRGLGYWLFYVRDAYAATTTASIDHLISLRTIVAGYLVLAASLVGLVLVRWEHRRFAVMLFGAGVILGVGVHPIDDPSPLMSLLVGDGEGGLALALRSSTRAVPVLLIGLALGAGALVSRVGELRLPTRASVLSPVRLRISTAAMIGVLSIVALPALRNGGFVDPALERDQNPPEAWLEAAAALDAEPAGYRVLQVPGTEFGAFQWGYTVDQPLPALTERALVTRDLLPLGSPAAMDLVFALDDRFQTVTVEPEAVVATARLLGVDTIWISGDIAFDRFQLARPEVVTDELTDATAIAAGLVDARPFGEPTVMSARIPMVDDQSLSDVRVGQPIAPVTLVAIENPIPTERVKDTVVVLAGSGDGIIDAGAAGVIDGTQAVLYAGALDPEQLPEGAYRYVLTDSNRDRAHHWRSSQDVTGFTESASSASDVLVFESGDQRLPVFDDTSASDQTVSIQEGPVQARASAYGERFAYLPEYRPVMAIDGDPSTAWTVADRAPAIGEFIELTIASGTVDHVDLLQPPASDSERTITQIELSAPGLAPMTATLDQQSRTGTGQRVEFAPTSGPITITITGTTTPMPPIGEAIGGVGFAEIDFGLGPTTEVIRIPLGSPELTGDATGIDIVLTRLRIEPTDRWRSDPEPTLTRRFELASSTSLRPVVTLRLDRRLEGPALAALLGESASATSQLVGAPATRGAAAFDGDPATAWTTAFDAGIGASVTLNDVGQASTITIEQPDGDYSPITAVRVSDGAGTMDLDLDPNGDAMVQLPRPLDLTDVTIEVVRVDPQMVPNRRFNEPTQLPVAISEVRFDGRSPEIAPLARLTGDCSETLLTLDGTPVPVRFDVATTDALAGGPITAEPCSDAPLAVGPGTHDVRGVTGSPSGVQVDRVVLSTPVEGGSTAGSIDPSEPVTVESSSRRRVLEVPACPTGCWVVHGEGFNTAWSASSDGRDLGAPTLIDGNANGWWLEPTTTPTRVVVEWTAQRPLDIAFVLSALAVLGCVGLVIRDRRRDDEVMYGLASWTMAEVDRRELVIMGAATAFGAALLIDPLWAVPTVVVWALVIAFGRGHGSRIVGAIGASVVLGAGVVVTAVVRSDRPFPDAGWPIRFEWLHGWTLFGVVLVVGAALLPGRRNVDR